MNLAICLLAKSNGLYWRMFGRLELGKLINDPLVSINHFHIFLKFGSVTHLSNFKIAILPFYWSKFLLLLPSNIWTSDVQQVLIVHLTLKSIFPSTALAATKLLKVSWYILFFLIRTTGPFDICPPFVFVWRHIFFVFYSPNILMEFFLFCSFSCFSFPSLLIAFFALGIFLCQSILDHGHTLRQFSPYLIFNQL